jgi:hypothetical protein
MPYWDSLLAVEASWSQMPPRRGFGLVPLALATLLSFAAGVGSTLLYLQMIKDEVSLAALPLIEADKAPTRVRPEGFHTPGPRVAQASSSGLPSPISSAMAAVGDPVVELVPQGIPAAPDLLPPAKATIVELPPPAEPAAVVVGVPVTPEPVVSREPQFHLQLASMRSAEGAREEMLRLKRLHATLLGSIELTVQRLDQGLRGVFYRVLSAPIGGRPDAAGLCSAITEKRGQCAVVALRSIVPAAPELHMAQVIPLPESPAPAVKAERAPIVHAVSAPPVPRPGAAGEPVMATSGGEVRAQLGSLRSMEGATREVARLSRLYGSALGPTELSVSRIDQGERGVFFRILTAPLPSRESGSDLCQRLLASQAGCVLISSRPTA